MGLGLSRTIASQGVCCTVTIVWATRDLVSSLIRDSSHSSICRPQAPSYSIDIFSSEQVRTRPSFRDQHTIDMCEYTKVEYACGHLRYTVRAWCESSHSSRMSRIE